MDIPVNCELIDVRCSGSKGPRPCHFLGYFQANGSPHTSVYYCPSCNSLNIITLDESGLIERKRTEAKDKVLAYATGAMAVTQ